MAENTSDSSVPALVSGTVVCGYDPSSAIFSLIHTNLHQMLALLFILADITLLIDYRRNDIGTNCKMPDT
jgi:hypothetical protein